MNLRLVLLSAFLAGAVSAQVPYERILNAGKDPANWLTYGGTYLNQRYSGLTQVTPANVKNLELKWVFQARNLVPFETTPLVVDGILYTIQGNDVVAMDAATGRTFWIFQHTPSEGAKYCCGLLSRGLGILGDTLYLGTADAHLIAVDAKTGHALWDVIVATAAAGYSIKHAPLVIKDKVVVGVSGGEYGIRGFLAAYDARTGRKDWHFNIIPGPGEPGNETWGGDSWKHGSGPIWDAGSYDPESNLTYWGVGNAGPDYNGDVRPGDNLYTCSVVALDADSGKLKWYYQFNPHNEFDWDAVQVPLLADIEWQGKPRRVMLLAQRNGFFYVLDRTTGEFLLAKPFVKQNWNLGFDEKGRPMMAPGAKSSTEGIVIFPGNQGGTNWFNPAYSPRTGLFYVNAWENTASLFTKREQEYEEGSGYGGGSPRAVELAADAGVKPTIAAPAGERGGFAPLPFGVGMGMPGEHRPFNYRMPEENYSAVRALDPQTGERKWEFRMSDATDAGILTTATDLLFTGNREGYFLTLDARTGKLLWKVSLGGMVSAGPITYSVRDKEYIATTAGNSLFVFGLRE